MIIMYSDGICVMSNTYNTFEKVWFCVISMMLSWLKIAKNDYTSFEAEHRMGCILMWFMLCQIPMMHWRKYALCVTHYAMLILTENWAIILTSPYLKMKIRWDAPWCFFLFLFMSDAHHGINSSTQKYQSTQSNVALTSCRQDSGSPPF